jgi:hypothetical protein
MTWGVEELSRDESKLRIAEWQARDKTRLQQSFWMTKQPREEKEDEGDGAEGKPEARRAA